MSDYEVTTLAKARSSYRWLVLLNCIHPFGYGAFAVVLYEFVLIAIAENDIAFATGIWGAANVIGKAVRIIISPIIGQVVDTLGRRKMFMINFAR